MKTQILNNIFKQQECQAQLLKKLTIKPQIWINLYTIVKPASNYLFNNFLAVLLPLNNHIITI